MRRLPLILAVWPLFGAAAEEAEVCYNYGCQHRAGVGFDEARLAQVRELLAASRNAAEERQAIAAAVGRLYAWAAEQTPIGADRGGNVADAGVEGRMDCIDHSTTTDGLLRLIERRGWLRHHHVLERVLRRRFLVMEHWSAVIEDDAGGRYVVDSWFGGAGRPPVVMPLDEWLSGGGEIVE